MKKIIALLTIVGLALGAQAQSYFGIKAGGGMSVLLGNVDYTHNPGPSYGGGLSYKQQIFKRVMLEGDVLFDLRSTMVPEYSDGSIGGMYVSAPITIHWNTPFVKHEPIESRSHKSKSYYFVEGGVNLAYGLNATTYVGGATPGGMDAGIVGGLGVCLANNSNLDKINIGLRGTYGFLNYNKGYEPAFTNVVFGAYVAYDFKLGGKRYYQYSM